MMKKNIVKEKLKNGEYVIGTFVRMDSRAVEILGMNGWDFAIIDVEHGVHTMSEVSNMIRAARSVGISPIVRVPGTNAVESMRALDAGADGVQIPQITEMKQIDDLCMATRYYPEGQRGMCSYVAAAGYSTVPFDEHMKTSNDEVLVVIHIENAWAASEIDAILERPGIDVVFCGPNDMSASLGVPGEMTHPEVTELLDKVFDACKAKGIATGMFVKSPDLVPHWVEKGVQYFACSTDVGMFAEYTKTIHDEMLEQINSTAY